MAVDPRSLELQAPSTRAITATLGSPMEDLAMERAKASFDVSALTRFLYGAEMIAVRKQLIESLESDPLFSKKGRYFMTRTERMERSLRLGVDTVPKFFSLGIKKDLYVVCGRCTDCAVAAVHERVAKPRPLP